MTWQSVSQGGSSREGQKITHIDNSDSLSVPMLHIGNAVAEDLGEWHELELEHGNEVDVRALPSQDASVEPSASHRRFRPKCASRRRDEPVS